MNDFIDVFRAQAEKETSILDKQNVVGVGVGYKKVGNEKTDTPALVAVVERKLPVSLLNTSDLVPDEINGVKVDVVELGRFQALNQYTRRYRPFPTGVSAGHYQIAAGTIGAVVTDNDTGEKLLLSNNHVFANSNNAKIGDPIIQPGTIDGGMSSDVIGHLYRYAKIMFDTDDGSGQQPIIEPDPPADRDGCVSLKTYIAAARSWLQHISDSQIDHKENLEPDRVVSRMFHSAPNVIDAALIKPSRLEDVLDFPLNQPDVKINRTASVELGDEVAKYGRTTGYTEGEITLLNATVDVAFGPAKVARFRNQFIIQNSGQFSAGGDSGSLIISKNGDEQGNYKAYGLLFAGSDIATMANPIEKVLSALRIRL